MPYRVFIDGQEGTTGLRIHERLAERKDLELIMIAPEKRKEPAERKRLMDQADVVFLCLPDAAAKEAVGLIENPKTRVIDASTAHRTDPEWVYGFPELCPGQREAVSKAKRIANPGCYATGFLSLARPLSAKGVLPADYPVVCHAISGYSGGGKKMIAAYEDAGRPLEYDAPRQYALSQTHKHHNEMLAFSGLSFPPAFNPIVSDFYSGMCVSVPLHTRLLNGRPGPEAIWDLLQEYYRDQKMVKVMLLQGEGVLEGGFLPSNALSGTDRMEIYVCGNSERVLLAACLDNLGKGASGAAVQNMNLALGLEETAGLSL